MTGRPKIPRSAYTARLAEFEVFAFAEEAGFQWRGRWRDFFRGRMGSEFNGRVIFEIGCADAAFLAGIARKFPEVAFVGLDWKCKAMYEAAQRVAREGLSNVALVRGRGQDIARIFGENEVDEVWVFHPDPCDKEAELKNRLMAEPFLREAHRVLREVGSKVVLKTDHPGYYQWMLGLMALREPEWFGLKGHGGRRVKTKELMKREDIPKANEAIQERFEVTMNSADFWNDPAALHTTATRYFAREVTGFEGRFIGKKLPIYYLELQKKHGSGLG